MKPPSRYERVSRRAMLRASLGAAAVAAVPGLACSNGDEEVFAGATAEPQPTTTTTTPPSSTTIAEPTSTQPAESATEDSGAAALAVDGEAVISFTYTQGVGGKNESPYVAVWIEDADGELLTTVALWYEQERRGERWLDHLSRWYDVDLARITAGGADTTTTISSATRAPGAYSVVWDGLVDGAPLAAGSYFVCIEAVREEGPYSLIREPFELTGTLAPTPLPDSNELSAASVRIDA